VSVKNLNFKGTWQGSLGKGPNTGNGLQFLSTLANDGKHAFVRVDQVEVAGFKYGGVFFRGLRGKDGFSDVRITNSTARENGDFGIKFQWNGDAADPGYAFTDVYVGRCQAYNNGGLPDRSGSTGNGILLEDVDGGTVERSVAHHNGAWNLTNSSGPCGIWTDNSNRVVIQYNESYSNKTGAIPDGSGFNLDGGTTNSVLQYNYAHDNDGPGLQVAQPTSRTARCGATTSSGSTSARTTTARSGPAACT
jgi:hypothetical protein